MVDLLVIIVLLLDFVVSIWNSYAAGFSLGLLRISKGPGWIRGAALIALAAGIAGETYVIATFLALALNAYGLVGADSVALLLAYNLVVTGGLITILGIGITAEGVYLAITHPAGWGVWLSLYNVFASIWNVFSYIRNFGAAVRIIRTEEREGQGQGAVIVLAAVAVVTAVLLSYIAFHFGRAHASGEYRGRVRDEDL